ncbi:MAG TPA: hypothetical protein VJZ91_01805, partial [Blastocatellia bacterium]|nr:hypothetical protein [Blastocatellia bacterium]
ISPLSRLSPAFMAILYTEICSNNSIKYESLIVKFLRNERREYRTEFARFLFILRIEGKPGSAPVGVKRGVRAGD